MANPNPSPSTRFQPGNPGGGRHKGELLATKLSRRLATELKPGSGRTIADGLIDRLVQIAAKGKDADALQAIKEIFMRHDGKVPEPEPRNAIDMKEVARKAKELRDRRKRTRTGGKRPD